MIRRNLNYINLIINKKSKNKNFYLLILCPCECELVFQVRCSSSHQKKFNYYSFYYKFISYNYK